MFEHRPPRLKNIDRTSGQSMDVTVGDVTVTITDYKPLRKERSSGGGDKSQSGAAKSAAASSAGAAANETAKKDSPQKQDSKQDKDKHTPTKEAAAATNGDVKGNS